MISVYNDPIRWAEATYDSPAGVIGSSWRHDDGIFIHEVRVPANTSATVLIPCPEGSEVTEPSGHATDAGAEGPYRKFEVPAGHYVFTSGPARS